MHEPESISIDINKNEGMFSSIPHNDQEFKPLKKKKSNKKKKQKQKI